jgi:hypothetical protein
MHTLQGSSHVIAQRRAQERERERDNQQGPLYDGSVPQHTNAYRGIHRELALLAFLLVLLEFPPLLVQGLNAASAVVNLQFR